MKTIYLKFTKWILTTGLVAMLVFTACERSVDGLSEPGLTQNPDVFIDGFSSGLEYYPFGDSKFTAFTVDGETTFDKSSASMRFDVPNFGDPKGPYAGAIFRDDNGGRDLSEYDALTFWAKATKAGTIDQIGFGQDFLADEFQVTLPNMRVSTNWEKYVIPIPDASRLTQEQGLFWYAEGPENNDGYTFWIDELKFEKLGTIAQLRPFIKNGEDATGAAFVGQELAIDGVGATFNLGDGVDISVNTTANYFTFSSSNPDVATADANGVSIVGPGNAVITAELDGTDATGSIVVSAIDLAPTPTRDANNVISIFSDQYTNSPVDYFNGYWQFSNTEGQDDININGNNVIKYSGLNFVGIEFQGTKTINASEMTHFHIDIYVENTLQAGDFIDIKLQDLGGDNVFGGGNDRDGTVRLTATSSIPLVNGSWVSADLPLSGFSGLTTKSNLAQIVFVTEGSNPNATGSITDILVDNMYFYK